MPDAKTAYGLYMVCVVFFHRFSAHGAFQCDLKELLGLDREFHRQLVHHLFGIAVDYKGDCLFGRDPRWRQ